MGKKRFAVVGAGAVGLASALQLQIAFPDADVIVIADQFNKDTTSFGAGGIFRPTPGKAPGLPLSVISEWLRDSWRFFSTLVHSEDAGEAGCEVISGYEFYNSEQDTTYMQKFVFAYGKTTERELNIYPGPKYLVGYRGTSIIAAPRLFLPYLLKRFVSNGGRVETRTLNTLEELVGSFDVVVNCSGFRARELVGDTALYASRGHLIKVKAPWIKNYFYSEDGKGGVCHVYPLPDFVVIGGVRQTGDESVIPRASDRDVIWNQACQVVPSLKKAEFLGEWVGLRPMRKPLRLESETIRFNKGELKVVHNYGHGGDGIALSWGTGAHAVRLVKQFVQGHLAISKY